MDALLPEGVVPFSAPYPQSRQRRYGIGDRREQNCPFSTFPVSPSIFFIRENMFSQHQARNAAFLAGILDAHVQDNLHYSARTNRLYPPSSRTVNSGASANRGLRIGFARLANLLAPGMLGTRRQSNTLNPVYSSAEIAVSLLKW